MRPSSVQPIRIALAIAAVLFAFLSWLFITDESSASRRARQDSKAPLTNGPAKFKDSGGRSPVLAPKRHFDPSRPAIAPLPPAQLATEGRSPIADELNSSGHTGIEDLAVVMNLFTHYRTRFRSYPVGEDNASIMNALSGQNPGRLAFISRNHPAIDGKGQLLDRWGQPFFFHLLGSDGLEIRSAGPDRELYTSDDLLTASPKAREAALAIDATE